MKVDLPLILDEFICLELKVAEIYNFFHETFSEDKNIWWGLCQEERNHAALIKSTKDVFVPLGKYPSVVLSISLNDLRESNKELYNILNKYKKAHILREDAFKIALQLENLKAEKHYQRFMEKKTSSKLDELFQTLNNGEKDHAKRLTNYMKQHGIDIA
ncbi:MAG: rubrerythrin family protein [Ignavibacteria bacterium]|nr:rubrerythrin family protein [Ignavibacteria bacterium]